jgi:protein-S-isoprenylcysteine O-methyltransferase Ste14
MVGAAITWTGAWLIGAYLIVRHPGAKFIAITNVDADQPIPDWIIRIGIVTTVIGALCTTAASYLLLRRVDLVRKPDQLMRRLVRAAAIVTLPPRSCLSDCW